MKTTWTNYAIFTLKGHYEYIKKAKGVKFARSWRKKIFDRTEYLKAFPRHGRQESSILHPTQEHRSLLEGNYRIVYRIEDQEVYIIHVFDTRQSPDKLVF
ncbi:MAG: type II toxin-antitoxin system RelE/ParE family toxin [Saprospiraceae bacterium]|nr:type II toxin-antitoxin system RelE/ParE family toxin [Saprospiraceae bacterium]MCF8249805.1 type II toxin-antitoxin system RelE/ParE family toxin [Saprospiraceae bacterium]MCF8279290.1 type II toxin-antitoxin system RelE/ParE family toxin [Bacteroidales bacterium]MCF8313444.1 type II toxin-antitoxin system RelE/ParE family toxin [Saprospiraceae bacterium]MCF8442157.1 type II toxin-antitoxin system RelE/ParE family toxin [Saprospiraceae bacterium]